MSTSVVEPATVPEPELPQHRPPALWKRIGMLVLIGGFAAFWVWALFFASKEAVNKIDDRAWADRAERICVAANETREALADYTRIDLAGPELIRQRADVVDAATDIVEAMLDDIVAQQPTDTKGAAIVPEWTADYRTYIADRRAYAERLRDTGQNLPFYETARNSIPLSDKVATFAGDNEMPSCSPPRDLAQ
ncbi:MAG TPA: hypothetical protein VNQ73_05820 [Ilumatobacter sp.]|nr:hypothetical protein [Ilumatobacter sp.]